MDQYECLVVNQVANKNHKCNYIKSSYTTTTNNNNNHKLLNSGCERLLEVKEFVLERRLLYMGDQLRLLIQQPHEQLFNKNNLQQERTIHAILKIYLKMLTISPLDFKLPNHNHRSGNPQTLVDYSNLRLQVVKYIESVQGYCNSISLLRLILKSPRMVRVIAAYKDIVLLITKRQEYHHVPVWPEARILSSGNLLEYSV